MVLQAVARVGGLRALREAWGFGGTVLAFAERDVRVKYKRKAVLGDRLGGCLQPLLFMAASSR